MNRLVQSGSAVQLAGTKYSDTPCCGPLSMSHNCFVVNKFLATEWLVFDDG